MTDARATRCPQRPPHTTTAREIEAPARLLEAVALTASLAEQERRRRERSVLGQVWATIASGGWD